MKALSLWQPWASLIAIGAKKVETRSWGTSYRGPLAIHAAKKYPTEARDFHEELARQYAVLAGKPLPLGAVVATCRLVACYRLSRQDEDALAMDATLMLPGDVEVTPEEEKLGHYSVGRVAWVLADVVALDPPIPAKGAMGLWEWTR